ncbi:hypothetical protein LCER1_G006103 [Lachnellula cervina]|uniref:Uncharacterized protein n=1 Tax=Lachnellula cervina TaxID=1316786 RepID=A0A7D8UQ97_9HELO|nr:hypothetical protein LCER1_G006103 [Lachnellula cervina]
MELSKINKDKELLKGSDLGNKNLTLNNSILLHYNSRLNLNCASRTRQDLRTTTGTLLLAKDEQIHFAVDLSMDFKDMLIDKNGFDIVLVIINRLGKQPITIPYHKTATLRDLA